MASRSGPFKTLRAAATYVASNTWYECTEEIQMGRGANCLRLYWTAAVASGTLIKFKIEHSPDETNYYAIEGQGEAPEEFGTYAATVGNHACEIAGINLPPNEHVKVYFQCSTGHGSATLLVKAMAFESAASALSFELGDIEIAAESIDVDTTAMEALLTTIDADTNIIQGDTTSLDTKAPALGTAIMTGCRPVTIATDDTMFVALDAAVDIIAGDTTSLDTKQPALGTAIMTGSSPVTIATDDTMFVAYNLTRYQATRVRDRDYDGRKPRHPGH